LLQQSFLIELLQAFRYLVGEARSGTIDRLADDVSENIQTLFDIAADLLLEIVDETVERLQTVEELGGERAFLPWCDLIGAGHIIQNRAKRYRCTERAQCPQCRSAEPGV